MTIPELLHAMARTPDCRLFPASGLPTVEAGHVLTDDLAEFYELCGGAVLYEHKDYPIMIVPAEQFRLSNPVIVGPVWERDDISASWYIVADDLKGGAYLTIDLSPERAGRCYDSSPYAHAIAGSSPIIARSFRELLERLYENRGEYWYWLRPDFEGLGDAYD